MRIATSTIFANQTNAIDNLVTEQALFGGELSTGKQLNAPSDDPTQIAQDLSIRATISQENQTSSNISNSTAQLTTADGALSTLSDLMQKVRQIAVESGSGLVNSDQQKSLSNEVDQLLQEAIGLANTQYSGQYVFAGTATSASKPVTANGQPASGINFSGNLVQQSETFSNGQSAFTSVTLQQAFNFQSTDGSPDVFQTLINLRNTLNNGTIVDQSTAAVNIAGTAITNATALNSPNFKTPLVPDGSGNISIMIASAAAPNGVVLTFAPTATIGAVTAAINGSGTGVTANFNPASQQLTLSSPTPFQIQDIPSPGAANTSNFLAAFHLNSQADMVNTVTRQIGDIDHVIQTAINARASIGASIQSLNDLGTATGAQVVNNTKVQSGIEDADIAKVVSQFSQTQTALQAAFGTTTRLESKTLFDFLQ